jgi:hypothetical protein
MFVDDATHAYRGYRLQALYILWRILNNDDANLIFKPEGKEDLALYSPEGELIEIVQIKAYSDNLTLSKLKPDKENSFFYRIHHEIQSEDQIEVRIISFNNLGRRLYRAFSENGSERKREASQLASYGSISEEEALHLFDLINPEIVDESTLRNEISDKISNSLMVDPDAAMKSLMFWVYRCSEQQIEMTHQDLVEYLHDYSPKTWDGIAGILRTLVWLGIKNFVDNNEAVLRRAYEKFGIGASLLKICSLPMLILPLVICRD